MDRRISLSLCACLVILLLCMPVLSGCSMPLVGANDVNGKKAIPKPIPEDLATDIPYLKSATETSHSVGFDPTRQLRVGSISYESYIQQKDIAIWYATNMPKDSWVFVSRGLLNDSDDMLVFKKGRDILTVTIADKTDVRVINVVFNVQ